MPGRDQYGRGGAVKPNVGGVAASTAAVTAPAYSGDVRLAHCAASASAAAGALGAAPAASASVAMTEPGASAVTASRPAGSPSARATSAASALP